MIECPCVLKKAKEVLEKYKLCTVPVDIDQICKNEHIKVQRTDLSEMEQRTNRTISGLIYVDMEAKEKIILVNNADKETRQTFTIAHELGHFFLHMPADCDGIIVSFRGLKNQREQEADLFAIELLMPRELVDREYRSLPFPTASYLANVFGVSKLTMQLRLEEMGLRYIA